MKKNLVALLLILGLVAGCATTSSNWASPGAITDLNSVGDDFEVAFSADGKTAVFASSREGGYGSNDIYISQLVGGRWQTPVNVGPAINSAIMDQEAALSDDGQILYFTRGVAGQAVGELFISRKVNGVWQTAENWNDVPELPHINSEFNEHCPLIVSKDLIYFSYEKPGVTQSDDLYQVKRVNGVWGKPEPLPGQINSTSREHLHWTGLSKDGNALIIVSDRPGGYGSSDQWISYKDSAGNWSAPENLGPLVNTSGGDFCWVFTPDGKYFVGVAARSGGQGGDDLYLVERSSIPLLQDFKPNGKPPINLLR
jgi:Tol biopolymer transport system component